MNNLASVEIIQTRLNDLEESNLASIKDLTGNFIR